MKYTRIAISIVFLFISLMLIMTALQTGRVSEPRPKAAGQWKDGCTYPNPDDRPCGSCGITNITIPDNGIAGTTYGCQLLCSEGATCGQNAGTYVVDDKSVFWCRSKSGSSCTQADSDMIDNIHDTSPGAHQWVVDGTNWNATHNGIVWMASRAFNNWSPCGRVQADVQINATGVRVAGFMKYFDTDCAGAPTNTPGATGTPEPPPPTNTPGGPTNAPTNTPAPGTPTVTNTPIPSATSRPSATPTHTPTATATTTNTPTATPTNTPNPTATQRPPTNTPTATPTRTPTATPTPTRTPTSTPTRTPTPTSTTTPVPTATLLPGQPTYTPAPTTLTPTYIAGQPTNTLPPGQPTNTLAPGQPTYTPAPRCDQSCGICGWRGSDNICRDGQSPNLPPGGLVCCISGTPVPTVAPTYIAGQPTNSPTPYPFVAGFRCDQRCGICGISDTGGVCQDRQTLPDNSVCCHNSCVSKSCAKVFGMAGDACTSDAQCLADITGPIGYPSTTPVPPVSGVGAPWFLLAIPALIIIVGLAF